MAECKRERCTRTVPEEREEYCSSYCWKTSKTRSPFRKA